MRRFLLILSGIAATLTAAATPSAAAAASVSAASVSAASVSAASVSAASVSAASVSAASVSAAKAGCVSAAAATYRHSFNGAAGTATITATRPLCSGQTQAVTLASYTTGAANSGQFIYDADRDTITATNRSITLKVAVPSCYTQVDAFLGSTLKTESTSTTPLYGTARLGSATGAGSRSTGPLTWYAGGSTSCTARPTVTFTNACDGTFTARLANLGTTPAVFLTGSRRIRVSPGATSTLRPAKGSTLTIRDSSFTTYITAWQTPAAACTTTPATATAAPLPAHPSRTATAATAPTTASTTSPTAAASTSTSTSPYSSPSPAYSTNPAALAAATSSDVPASGRGIGSIIAIALGLLLIATGAAAIAWLIRLNRQPA